MDGALAQPKISKTSIIKVQNPRRMQALDALSRQVALLAEPKNPPDSTMSTSSGFFVHTMKHCTIHY